MSIEVYVDGMSDEAKFMLYDNITNALGSSAIGEDPLEIILELEQLALDNGYHNVFEYIEDQLNRIN